MVVPAVFCTMHTPHFHLPGGTVKLLLASFVEDNCAENSETAFSLNHLHFFIVTYAL